MLESRDAAWLDGTVYLIQIDGISCDLETLSGHEQVPLRGEISFCVCGDHLETRGLAINHCAFTGSLSETGPLSGGKLSIMGKRTTIGAVQFQEEDTILHLEGDVEIYYDGLDREDGTGDGFGYSHDPGDSHDQTGDCYFLPSWRPASFLFEGRVEIVEDKLNLTAGHVRFVGSPDQRNGFRVLSVDLAGLRLQPLLPVPGSAAAQAGDAIINPPYKRRPCPPELIVNRRQLIIQPVGFRDDEADDSPSGTTLSEQLAVARAVWNKACIDIVARPIEIVTRPNRKNSSNLTAIRRSYTSPEPNVIEVFFVQNRLRCCGGGNAGAIGSASQKVVIGEPNNGNPVLLAHELGHALGLLHPGQDSNADANTVMTPTGGVDRGGNDRLTFFTAMNIRTPALSMTMRTSCLTCDRGDHYIRDFPEDSGRERLPTVPNGRNRFAFPNVWNRLTQDPGSVGEDGPDHQQPVRFDENGKPKTNFLFARVDQRNPLLVRDARVRFFASFPGTGAGQLQPLGEASLKGRLSVGIPETVAISWQLPAGFPANATLLAAVSSPGEPDTGQTALSWLLFDELAGQDNDWARRATDVRKVAVPVQGLGTKAASAPMLIRVPADMNPDHLGVLTLRVNTRRAIGLDNILLEIPDLEHFELEPDADHVLKPKHPYRPGEAIAIIVHGDLPAGNVDRCFAIDIEPSFGGRPLSGFSTYFESASETAFADQFSDELHAALNDLHTAGVDGAAALFRTVREHFGSGPYQLAEHGAMFMTWARDLAAVTNQIKEWPVSRRFAIKNAFERFSEEPNLDTFSPGTEPWTAFSDFTQRLRAAAAAILHDGIPEPDQVTMTLHRIRARFSRRFGIHQAFYFEVTVVDGPNVSSRRYPEEGQYFLTDECRCVDYHFEDNFYHGPAADNLNVRVNLIHLDGIGRAHLGAAYSRLLKGDADSYRGMYQPEDESNDPEQGPIMCVFYEVR